MKARDLIQGAKNFALAHWDYAGPLIGLAVGFLLGKVL